MRPISCGPVGGICGTMQVSANCRAGERAGEREEEFPKKKDDAPRRSKDTGSAI